MHINCSDYEICTRNKWIKADEISKIAKDRYSKTYYTFPCVYCVNQVFWHDHGILLTERKKQRMIVTLETMEWTGQTQQTR
jgi:hypothetical protein